jgi:hypothetical protein
MTNKIRAVLWFLSDTDEHEVKWRIQDLEEADCNTTATNFVNVWQPFEHLTVQELLDEIEKLEEQFDDCQQPLRNIISKAKMVLKK